MSLPAVCKEALRVLAADVLRPSRVATNVTFKQAKGELAKKGWDPRGDSKGDKLYWLNGTTYEALDGQSWSQIETGRAKL